MTEIKGDVLHTFLMTDMQGRFMAVNNAAVTKYERKRTQDALVKGIIEASKEVQDGAGKETLSDKVKGGFAR